MTRSISFDRAADYYDQTRSLPDHLMDQLVPLLVAELPRDGRCLEIGIGTGRIALPLIERGIDVVGVDISIEMLRRFIAKAGRRAGQAAVGDATRLPFRDRAFTSAIAAHVLHLIPDWKAAIDELLRVIKPRGVLLASRSADTKAEWHRAVRKRFFLEAGDPPWPPGIDRIESLDQEMRERGATVRVLRDVRNETSVSISDLIAALEKGVWSACWSIDEELRHRAAAATREWAVAKFGDLDLQRPTRHESDWRAYVSGK
ncbi:MAG TPA: class I SAM-dependent methyltransferase [Candidatus Dormibacteraeota bacterium]